MNYRTQGAMTRAMVRFQEHYEHPEFRGKVFSIKDFKAYTLKREKEFTYFTDVFGFNFPSETLDAFIKGKFNPLSKREKAVLDSFVVGHGFYIIATYKSGNLGDIAHEISHGLYYTRPKYRKKVKEILADQEKIGGMGDWRKAMANNGYHKAVIQDEIHAYMMESDEYLMKRFKKEIPRLHRFAQARKRLWEAYNLEVGV